MIELYDHQKTALGLLRLNDGFALFMEQGTGKTFPVLFRLAELAESRRIRSALIAAPKAVCASWEEKIELLDEAQRAALKGVDLVIASYDITWRRKGIFDATFDAVVFDESHYIKSPAANRTQTCLRISSRAKYRWILTGTPTSNGQLCNLWSQFAAIDPVVTTAGNGHRLVYPRCLGGDSYYKWIQRVAYLNKWKKPYKYKDVSAIQAVMGEMSYRITKEECLDLPEKLPDEILYCDLGHSVKRHYGEMVKSSAITSLDTLAGNPLTRSLRLRQMCSGFVDTENGERKEYACPKETALKEFLSDFEGKFVVFCEFRHSVDSVGRLLGKLGIRHVVLDGRQRDKGIWRKFQDDEGTQAIICQYQSGSAGIDLFAADTCIFYEPTLRSDLLEQARDRIHRVGQSRPCSYYFLLTAGTVEIAIYNALKNYSDFNEALFAEYISEYTKGMEL
ncbi:DEAD/DEAH box helicase [Adlercreutzia sp. ZJ242]|uniref:DEAD/DEAH box helicase n=1 Tax=Adlercreutzia sp. ZJ242 TaxID=2709409 RepID=UPI0013EA84D7|nr:DEAD/DEAH box helicase [Adlercreutzia sp. ZJ242]